MEENELHTPNIETKPLLTPTMESELLKDGWSFPPVKERLPKQEDNAVFGVWQENFQDLSGWCMDVLQTPCDFHIGESQAFKISGTKYEDNDDVLTSEEGGLKSLASAIQVQEKQNIKMDSIKPVEFPDVSNSFIRPTLLHIDEHKQQQHHHHHHHHHHQQHQQQAEVTNDKNAGDHWSDVPRNTFATNRIPWNKETAREFHAECPVGELYFDGSSPTHAISMESQRESWDVLRTIESAGSDTFDLLSYVCDEEIRSPEGSTSTDSSFVSKLRSPAETVAAAAAAAAVTTDERNVRINRVEEKYEKGGRPGARIRSVSTATRGSSSAAITLGPIRRSERTKKLSVTKVEEDEEDEEEEEEEESKAKNAETRLKAGRKRFAESDSDDDSASTISYRESREKNNEASRKSRMNKKAKEKEMAVRAIELERDNRILKMKVEELEKLVTSMRNALLRSALKKDI
ncbi:hepatic leukemia factor-like [Prorops nasuta]|uniref:hepatic leukemia factor-like n=1 Tax=Prorops nasuta TaxID=863751 RepID=UPI0034CF14DD